MKPPRQPGTLWTVAAALVLLALGAIGAFKAGLVGADYMYDLEQSHPALADVPPTLSPSPPPRAARRVVIAIVDGLRLDASHGLPYLDELRRRGIDGQATSAYPTFSRPNYVTILTGVPPEASGVRTNMHGTAVPLDAIMDRVHAAGLHAGFASDYDPMPRLFLRPEPGARRVAAAAGDDAVVAADPAVARAGTGSAAVDDGDDDPSDAEEEAQAEAARERGPEITDEAARRRIEAPMVGAFDDARYAPWPGGFVSSARRLVASGDDLVVLLVGVVDAAGHQHGGASPEYAEAARTADRALRRALAGVDLDQDAVIVVADHGHTDSGGHGGLEPEVVNVPLIVAGRGVVPGAVPRGARLVDVAPTAAALLGLPPPGHGLGRTLTELLALDLPTRAQIGATDAVRVGRNLGVVGTAVTRADASVLERRALRIGLVVGLMAVAVVLAWGLRRMGGLRLDWRVLLVGVPAFFIVYYTLIGVLGQRFSPSLLPARGHLARELIKYGAIGTAVHMVAGLFALRARRTFADRLAAANGVAWLGLLISMASAGLLWAYYPPPYVEVPGPKLMVLIPAVEVAVACYAVAVALSLIVEVIVFVARAADPEARAIRLERAAARARERARKVSQADGGIAGAAVARPAGTDDSAAA